MQHFRYVLKELFANYEVVWNCLFDIVNCFPVSGDSALAKHASINYFKIIVITRTQPQLNLTLPKLGLTWKWLYTTTTHHHRKLNVGNISAVTGPILMKL